MNCVGFGFSSGLHGGDTVDVAGGCAGVHGETVDPDDAEHHRVGGGGDRDGDLATGHRDGADQIVSAEHGLRGVTGGCRIEVGATGSHAVGAHRIGAGPGCLGCCGVCAFARSQDVPAVDTDRGHGQQRGGDDDNKHNDPAVVGDACTSPGAAHQPACSKASMGAVTVAVHVWEPGNPAANRSDNFTLQATVTVMSPPGTSVDRSMGATVIALQVTRWLVKVSCAADCAAPWASAGTRCREAARAAWAAATSTCCLPCERRPMPTMSSISAISAGAMMTISTAADPRSPSLLRRMLVMTQERIVRPDPRLVRAPSG